MTRGVYTRAETAADLISGALAAVTRYLSAISKAIYDDLTNLYNRRYFEETLIRELSRAGRSHQRTAIVLLDLDHFKAYNDSFGIVRAMNS